MNFVPKWGALQKLGAICVYNLARFRTSNAIISEADQKIDNWQTIWSTAIPPMFSEIFWWTSV